MILKNLEPNHTDIMFARALHPINIERLSILYYDHVHTLDFGTRKNTDQMADRLRIAIDFLPITHIKERFKQYEILKHDYTMYKDFMSPDDSPMRPEVLDNIYRENKQHAVRYLSFQLRKLISQLQEPILRVPYKFRHHPAYGHPGTPGFINYIHPLFDKIPELNKLIINVATTHEKGHGLRFFIGKSDVTNLIVSCLDVKEVLISEVNKNFILENYNTAGLQSWEIKKGIANFYEKEIYNYYFTPHEILERMAQLKNYFGFTSPDDEFTLEHLDFAREHYVRDFGFFGEVQMYPFLSAISKRTEKKFITLMNELPI